MEKMDEIFTSRSMTVTLYCDSVNYTSSNFNSTSCECGQFNKKFSNRHLITKSQDNS